MFFRIRHCKDYYEILQVSREFSDSQIKKKYYELALKLHPDKCKVPGSTEAFKGNFKLHFWDYETSCF